VHGRALKVTGTILAAVGSVIAGALVATVTVVGLVNQQTGPGANPTDSTKPITINYGTNG
jgi:hypothetical protein